MTSFIIAIVVIKVKMCPFKYYVLIFTALVFDCSALNCRSDGGPKEEELKTIYVNCLKKQENKNSSDHRSYTGNQDSRTNQGRGRGSDRRNGWAGNRDDSRGNQEKGFDGRDSRFGDRGQRMDGMNDRTRNGGGDMSRKEGRNNRMNSKNDRMGGTDNRESGGDNRMWNRDDRFERDEHINSRDDLQSEEYRSDTSRYNPYGLSTQTRRYKRERQVEMNSGHRSQYNPNTSQKPIGYEDSYSNEEKNFSENNTSNDFEKSCVLHCFLEELEMTGDDGMPDRYLVTHTITKDVKNEDLRDFLQESIEECFQILDNENTEDKCEFSKTLMMCLSEKGRANCDDWKDDMRF